MQSQELERSPLTVCVEQLRQTSGPAVRSDNAVALAAKLMSERTTLQACSHIMLGDLGLTLRLLRIANSAMFNQSGKTVMNVTHAAALLGTDALSEMLDSVPRQTLLHPVRELVALSHLTAVLASRLMGRVEPRYREEAFVSGLFRNMGEISFAMEMPEKYKQILRKSQGTLTGLRASSRMQAHFDFDELTAGLLHHWSLYGPPELAVQSTPEALLAQHGIPEASIALSASLAHAAATAYYRAETAERDKLMRPCWGAFAKVYQLREAQVESLCEEVLESMEGFLNRLHVCGDQLRFKPWVPSGEAEVAPEKGKVSLGPGATMKTLLDLAVSNGIDRAAWLPYDDPEVRLAASSGGPWPDGRPDRLVALLPPKKPPFLLAFSLRQDVWIDFGKDDRFRDTPLGATMQPAVFFLFPVCEGRKVRGCLYFDWTEKKERAAETMLPELAALRDYLATNIASM